MWNGITYPPPRGNTIIFARGHCLINNHTHIVGHAHTYTCFSNTYLNRQTSAIKITIMVTRGCNAIDDRPTATIPSMDAHFCLCYPIMTDKRTLPEYARGLCMCQPKICFHSHEKTCRRTHEHEHELYFVVFILCSANEKHDVNDVVRLNFEWILYLVRNKANAFNIMRCKRTCKITKWKIHCEMIFWQRRNTHFVEQIWANRWKENFDIRLVFLLRDAFHGIFHARQCFPSVCSSFETAIVVAVGRCARSFLRAFSTWNSILNRNHCVFR